MRITADERLYRAALDVLALTGAAPRGSDLRAALEALGEACRERQGGGWRDGDDRHGGVTA